MGAILIISGRVPAKTRIVFMQKDWRVGMAQESREPASAQWKNSLTNSGALRKPPSNRGNPYRRVAPIARLTTDRPNNSRLGLLRLLSLYRHIYTQATTKCNNKTAFTITAAKWLLRDSRPRFSTNHLGATLITNPSSFNVVNLVPGRGNLGFHSRCICEHVFQLIRKSRYNDVEISLLQQFIH
jgi:hypothetical protein